MTTTSIETRRVTGKEWAEACEWYRVRAAEIGRVFEKHGGGWGRDVEALRDIIRANEKAHRRYAPAGYRHRLPVERAVDYFVVKCFAEAPAPDAPVSSLVGIRDDFVKAALLAVDPRVRPHLLPLVGDDAKAALAKWDYVALVGDK